MQLKTPFLIIAFAVSLSLCAAEDWKLPAGEPQFKRAAGAELAIGNCLICHSADYISMQPPLDAAGWTAIVTKMREKYGAPLPPENIAPIVNYLVTNYGKPPTK
jgi:mono/diheme cytochrome c family protein